MAAISIAVTMLYLFMIFTCYVRTQHKSRALYQANINQEVVQIIYRLKFHPLARYPGPFLSRISSLSIPLQAASGDRHLHQLQEHQRYGPIVRIGPSSLSFASPAALRTIYQSSRAQNPLRKSDYYKTVDAPAGAYSTHTEISRRKHAFRRRVLDHAFSEASMRPAEEFVLENIRTFCKLLGPESDGEGLEWSRPRNMRSSELLYWFIVRPILCSPTLMKWFGGQFAQDEHEFVAYASACVKDRISKEHESDKVVRKDMMYFILDAKDPVTGQPFTNQDLDAESSLLIAAGGDTTSTVLAAAFFYLTLPTSESVLNHAQKQLRERCSSPSDLTWTEVRRNTYLRAIVEETLRMAPAAPSELPRTILQKPGLDIAGEFIPSGTTVGCSAYVLHHNEEAFPSSFSFRPERWIAISKEDTHSTSATTHLSEPSYLQHPDQVSRAREAFCAFSLGSRGCVGKALAYMELCLTLAHVLWAFDFRRAENGDRISVRSKTQANARGLEWREFEYQLRDVFITDRAGPLIKFRRAQRPGVS
ncbi:hypothetical protein LTR64_003683 [Lithohypha guttulata]|uniref:uncharacterized protein n=1 Tax=Lithohypha guttulata TaxID=1690604 RepID=UPI00315C6D57